LGITEKKSLQNGDDKVQATKGSSDKWEDTFASNSELGCVPNMGKDSIVALFTKGKFDVVGVSREILKGVKALSE
jgi:hypothetical protein